MSEEILENGRHEMVTTNFDIKDVVKYISGDPNCMPTEYKYGKVTKIFVTWSADRYGKIFRKIFYNLDNKNHSITESKIHSLVGRDE